MDESKPIGVFQNPQTPEDWDNNQNNKNYPTTFLIWLIILLIIRLFLSEEYKQELSIFRIFEISIIFHILVILDYIAKKK